MKLPTLGRRTAPPTAAEQRVAKRDAEQRKRGHGMSARQMFASNRARMFVRTWDARGVELPPKRTSFRNVIDEKGRHV